MRVRRILVAVAAMVAALALSGCALLEQLESSGMGG